MQSAVRIVSVALVGMVVSMGSNFAASSADGRSEILKAREAVWRAWFANDTKTSRNWCHQTLSSSALERINGRPRPKCFNQPLTSTKRVEGLFDWSSHAPRFSASGMS